MRSSVIELRKLMHRKKYIVLCIIQMVIIAAFVLGMAAMANFMSQQAMGGFMGLAFSDLPTIPYNVLTALTSLTLPLYIFMMCSDSFAHEIEDGTIRCVFMRPITRFKAYLSKIGAIWLFVIANLLASALVCIIVGAAATGSVRDTGGILAAYLLSAVPMLPFIAMSSCIAILVQNGTLSMFLSIIACIVMFVVTLLSQTVGAIFYINRLGYYRIFQGISFDQITVSHMASETLLLLSTSMLFGIAGLVLFERKQI